MAKRLVFTGYLAAVVLFASFGCEPSSGGKKLAKFVLRVNCAAFDTYTDKAGNEWLPDQEWEEGQQWGAVLGNIYDHGELNMTGTSAPKIYETERYSVEAYKFLLANGQYTVRLYFAENYDGITGVGQRVFSVTINDKTVLKDFDPYKVGGFGKPIVKKFKHVAVTDGKLTVGFIPNIENPEINGIEILSE
jgi:hypothetical protein